MTTTAGVLTVLTDRSLREDVDRVAAAVGIRVVHADSPALLASPINRRTWTAAAAVVLDDAALRRCGRQPRPRRAHVVVVTDTEPTTATWAAAVAVGAQTVLRLPAQEHELVAVLAEAGDAVRGTAGGGPLVAVTGGCGGAGASLFAAALAHCAADALLVDLDPCSGGLDLLIGDGGAPGLRWPDLDLRGGRLNWSAVRAALPRHRGVTVLSAARHRHEPAADAVAAVIDAGRRGGATVICDLPRRLTGAAETALDAADLVVLVSRCEVRAAAATAAVAPVLAALNPNVGLVVRGPAPGGLRAAEIAGITTVPLLASMRAEPRLADQLEHGGLRLRRRSALAAAARAVLTVLPSGRVGEPAA